MKNRNPREDPDHNQKSTTSRGSSLARACQVWSMSVSAFVSYPVYIVSERMKEWQRTITYNIRLIDGGYNNNNKCVSKTDTNPPFAFQIAFPRGTDFTRFLQEGQKLETYNRKFPFESNLESNRRIIVYKLVLQHPEVGNILLVLPYGQIYGVATSESRCNTTCFNRRNRSRNFFLS